MKHRTEGHTETTISGDTRADWSEVFALLADLQVGYIWHASKFTSEVLAGLLRIGFVCFPYPANGGCAVPELLHRDLARQAVPDLDQAGCGPVCSQLRERSFVTEEFRVRCGFGFLNVACSVMLLVSFSIVKVFIFVLLSRCPPRSGH